MKVKEFQKKLHETGVEVALFFSGEIEDPATVYFTGLDYPQHTALAIPAKGEAVLYSSGLDIERASANSRLTVKQFKERLLDTLQKELGSPKAIGFHGQWLSKPLADKIADKFPQATLIDVTEQLEGLRILKTNEEIQYLKEAARIADEAFAKMLKEFDTCKTEVDVAALLEFHIRKAGSRPAFPTIVASGKNASKPHHLTSKEKLHNGFCVIDFGATYNNYRSDMTRTVFIGKPTDKDKALYDLVLRSNQAGIEASRQGISCAKVDEASRELLGEKKEFFIHSLGHGVGVEVHEAPSLSPRSEDTLRKGMVFTIEPGIYEAGAYGIRIEDMVVLGEKKEVITRTSKALTILSR